MNQLQQTWRPAWLTHTSLDLRGISPMRRHAYFYTLLLLLALLGGAMEDYRQIMKDGQARERALRVPRVRSVAR
jgi:hypothetical protein